MALAQQSNQRMQTGYTRLCFVIFVIFVIFVTFRGETVILVSCLKNAQNAWLTPFNFQN